jgi:hypothetical protein
MPVPMSVSRWPRFLILVSVVLVLEMQGWSMSECTDEEHQNQSPVESSNLKALMMMNSIIIAITTPSNISSPPSPPNYLGYADCQNSKITRVRVSIHTTPEPAICQYPKPPDESTKTEAFLRGKTMCSSTAYVFIAGQDG